MEEPGKLCPAEKKPDIKKIDAVPCNPHECKPYSWVRAKGVCSVSCGNGKCRIDKHMLLIEIRIPLQNTSRSYELISCMFCRQESS